jgi:hypothetical protein
MCAQFVGSAPCVDHGLRRVLASISRLLRNRVACADTSLPEVHGAKLSASARYPPCSDVAQEHVPQGAWMQHIFVRDREVS